jgi:hypothetical protein
LIVVVRVRPPPVPVTVTLAAPKAAAPETVRVSVLLVPVTDSWLKLAVTPLGAPLALNSTLPAKPLIRVIVIALVPLDPRLIVRLVGLAERVKSGGGGRFTVKFIVAVRVRPPPVPVTVTVAPPRVAALDAARVNTLPVPVGLKLAVTPLGNPLAINVTLLVKPFRRVTVIAHVPLAPRLIVRLVGLAESVKLGGGGWFTVRLIVVVRVRPPPVPVTVTVAAPSVAELDAVKVRMLSVLLALVVEPGPKLAVTPLGNPLALKDTLPVKPPLRVVVIGIVPLAPRLIVRFGGLAESAKSGGELLFPVVKVRSPDVDRLPASSFDFTL